MTIQATRELGRIPTNSTGSMSRKTVQDHEGYYSIVLLYSYGTIIGYVKDGRCVLMSGGYSTTTAQHLSKYRDEFGLERGDTFDYPAFVKRASIDSVNVKGGWNN
jgi:hypothetical protein